ncbi:MAG: putative Ig domain-containing protein, partial [Novosphingobium sp.]
MLGLPPLGLMFGRGYMSQLGGGAPAPSIRLSSNAPIAEDTEVGATLATIFVAGGSGTYTHTITSDPDSKFSISSNELQLAALVDYETAAEHSVTISSDNGVDEPISRTFTFDVSNVLEQPSLSALTLADDTIPENAAATIAIVGATAGSTITLVEGALPAGMTLDGAARSIDGTPSAVGSASFVLRETLADSPNSPRDTALGIEVTEATALSGHLAMGDSWTWETGGYADVWAAAHPSIAFSKIAAPGWKVADLQARVADAAALAPRSISVLIGLN